MIRAIQYKKYVGKIKIPSSKSDAQRALLIASLGEGTSIIKNVGKSKDECAMISAIQNLGAKINVINDTDIEISGISSVEKEVAISLSESGLAFRLFASAASLFDKKITLNASGSLLGRPMDFFEQTLPKFGVKAVSNNGFPPVSIVGPLKGNSVEIDGSLSSQFLSGLLIALPLCKENSRLLVKDLKSIPYVDMTLHTLEKFGVKITNNNHKEFLIEGNQKIKPTSYSIEGDWSSASCWLVASALGKDIAVENLNLDSLQADKEILELFKRANCNIILENNAIKIDGSKRKNFIFDATHCPDLFAAIAVFAALTRGENKIIGTDRLIYKESNRAKSIFEEFSKLGVKISLEKNEMIIHGSEKINGGEVHAHNDHRIAMCLAILGMFSNEIICIKDAEAVEKSYPNFWKDLDALN